MRIGLIARADSRGLGVQTKAFHDQMSPVKTMVVDCPSANPLPLRHDWYPDATWIHGLPTHQDFRAWLDGLDVVYTAETGYGTALWDEAERAGVRTVLHANYEFLDCSDRPTLWAAPSMWHFDDFPTPKHHLPVPIDTLTGDDYCHDGSRYRRFLHVVGRPAIHDRNGTADLLNALQYVESDIAVTITCQQLGYVEAIGPIPDCVTIRSGDVTDHRDLYRGQDVLIMPRRFGGLCLPANEALGAGMPVIMPDISPNNTWLPSEWLVPATHTGSFRAKQYIDYVASDVHGLAALIDRFATDLPFQNEAQRHVAKLTGELSWPALRPAYETALEA